MGDEMDPCECLWNHEMAMRRLIRMLRQGQTHCTDTDCIDQLQGLPQPPSGSASDSFLIMFLIMALAVAMYMMRPRRNQIRDAAKPTADPQDRDGAPPTPPRI